MSDRDLIIDRYKDLLKTYLKGKSETALYKGQQFSRKLIEQQISPDDVLSDHVSVLHELFPDMSEELKDSFDFLLEVMIGYGFAYREHQSLRTRQRQLESEIEVAASMQQTLLMSDVPTVDGLDIGVKSVPAKKMNGDYFNFVKDHKSVSIAVADIIGKGIPAALCMSMIKYAMDSLPEQRMQPNLLLENLNRVVEQNVHPNMFITMLYGLYDTDLHEFYYAGAGHEPGFFYRASEDRFEDMFAKGLVLGVSRQTRYKEYQLRVNLGDMIILLSDGVTECRTSKGFIERDEIVDLIRAHMHKPAQEVVESVFNELERLQEFELRDDFTLIILKRKV
ncbi:indirect positive regulator of sigma-B activity [Fictibacillus macauensis ZFHKF-1]|uniref:Indirect positive regulator of sigma-B activity n=1 Tax=Fictibacillus macauensis ZFHKF-1 TaxID=1196324 RepID=I8ANL9_9BACL|nr:PP2C family protein-serine/threonine phosphatase [Fictibacillus macauensis]EIT87429.1 indirect positive regulator of sigma-B activity [Fictibacillus macauensis ZFHKF-1]